ncbi:2-oxoglutarate and iron-dependent oxygenase domain-containing protein [Octadecabacter arcticus]|uniref:2-oxoglutarate and iron-dependent oxygenase domain-containing protein n=1 Tax=Octadecabacter arcticus TaxID=53946 RepID=UPI0009FEA919
MKDPNSSQFAQTADNIGEAARSFGFFRICDHGIDSDLFDATYKVAAILFARPDVTKRLYYIGNSSNHRGYVPFTEKGNTRMK